MLNRLKILYQLQLIDNELDRLEEHRGDLPSLLSSLEERINELQRAIDTRKAEQEEFLEKRKFNEIEIERLLENQKKFKSQLYSVRNNKEYDALTKEIDHTEETIKKLEMENDALADTSKKFSSEI